MPRNSLASYETRILQVVFGLGLLGVFLIGIRSMAHGSKMNMTLAAFGCICLAVILWLDDRFWALPAFLFSFHETLPLIKFTGMEFGAIVMIGTFSVRFALRRLQLRVAHTWLVLLCLPFLAWMCFVWFLHPTGMLILGSSSFGGRFYFKVILSFMALCCMSMLRLSEEDCKWLFGAVLLGGLANLCSRLMYADPDLLVQQGSTHYVYLRLSYIAPLFLARFSAPELLVHVRALLPFLILFGLSLYSGNRTAAARPVLFGIFYPFYLRRDRMKTMVLAIFAVLALAIVVVGQGRFWNLPYSLQRSMSFLPGKWDYRLERYGFNDDFRAYLRDVAREHIRANPWTGDGGFSLDATDMMWVAGDYNRQGMYAGHILSRNWHNIWYGMAADFGIPLSVAWGVFIFALLVNGYRWRVRLVPHSWQESLYTYFYLLMAVQFVNFFFDGGHSATTPELFFIWTGWMLAVLNGAEAREA